MTKEKLFLDVVVVGVEYSHTTNNGNSVYNVFGIDCWGDLMIFKTAANSGLSYTIENFKRKFVRIEWTRRGNSWEKIIRDIKVIKNEKYKSVNFDWEN